MAEKRRTGPVMSDSRSVKCDSDESFVCQSGVSALLTGALLKLLESRSEDPIGFLAEHFCHVSEEEEEEDAGGPEDASRALWHLSLDHHSHRSAFNNNVRVAYELLTQSAPRRRSTGGVRGVVYTEVLRCLCSEGGLSGATAAPLLHRIQCHDHEAVPFELFRQGVLTCSVFADYIRKSQCLYAAVASAPDRPAERALCQAVLATLREALETGDGADVARYLEASAKISPAKVAQAMAEARPPSQQQEGPAMDAQEFEDAAAALFIARVRKVT